MNVRKFFIGFVCCVLSWSFLPLMAQNSEPMRPRWISETPKPCNPTYDFVIIRATGETPQIAASNCLNRLMNNTDLKSSVEAIVNRHSNSHQHQQINNGKMTEQIVNTVTVDVTINGKRIGVTANPVDEYWEYIKMGDSKVCECYTLYMVAVAGIPPVYDNVSFTRYYGTGGLIRSLIPGCGQIYKGSMTKGLLFLGGEAVSVAGIILCETTRASYAKKMREQPKHAQVYNDKKENWTTGRNICIGAAAALYIYNLIDAFAAKGAKRTIVKPYRPIHFSVAPVLTDETFGVGIAMNF